MKKILLPIGFNAEQSREGILSQFSEDECVVWMTVEELTQQYLKNREMRNLEERVDVWLLVCDSPHNMLVPKGQEKSPLEITYCDVLTSLYFCKGICQHLLIRVLNILPINHSGLYNRSLEKWAPTVVDSFHTIDLEAKSRQIDENLDFMDFMSKLDCAVAEAIKNPMGESSCENKDNKMSK